MRLLAPPLVPLLAPLAQAVGMHPVHFAIIGVASKATGRAMEADFGHVWWLRDHKVAGFKPYVDSALVQRAIAP